MLFELLLFYKFVMDYGLRRNSCYVCLLISILVGRTSNLKINNVIWFWSLKYLFFFLGAKPESNHVDYINSHSMKAATKFTIDLKTSWENEIERKV